jgi:hypothetical protein
MDSVPLLRRSSAGRNRFEKHCFCEAVAHCGEKCGLTSLRLLCLGDAPTQRMGGSLPNGQPVRYVENNNQLRRLVEAADDPYVLTTDEHATEFESQFPGEFSVVARRDRFLIPGQVVVLARDTPSPTPHTAARIVVSGENLVSSGE